MFNKVLFPTDFSADAHKTLECIGEIPGVKEVVLLHVVDATHPSKHGWIHGPHVEDAKLRLEEHKEYLESLGLDVTTKVDIITYGSIPESILETADKENVSLIVMNAHGKSLIKGLLLGSVPLAVMRHAKTDVLLMRYKLVDTLEGEKLEKFCEKIFSKVLYPTDFSEPAEDALSFVKDLKGVEEIGLVHVVTKGETEEEIETNVREAKKKLEVIKDKLDGADFKVKDYVRVGSPAEEICSVAEDEDASLIAMSSHGKGWFKELLLGDTTFDVVKNTKRPVLVVRAKMS
ncbi:Universal stress protein [uncultured archaeon]|nr:Universal stress protein [uncultured archaeon]